MGFEIKKIILSVKILIIQTAFIGDVVLATPLIESLKIKYPDCTIDFLVQKGNESLLAHHPLIRQTLIFDKKQKKYRNLIRLIKTIRSHSYDYVINVQRFFTTGLITALSNARVKIGFDKNPLSFTFTHCISHTISRDNNIHEVHRNLSLIKCLVDEKFRRPKLYPLKKDEKLLPACGEYICIAPSSIWFTKQFPIRKWCELINEITAQYKVYLLGGLDDVPLCREIQRKTDPSKVEILAGKLTFLQSTAYMKKAKMTFTNDSAPMHFASAINAPVTAIFCSTLPEFGFGPLSNHAYIIETDKNLPCRPCGLHGKKNCPEHHFKCANISIEKILSKVKLFQDTV